MINDRDIIVGREELYRIKAKAKLLCKSEDDIKGIIVDTVSCRASELVHNLLPECYKCLEEDANEYDSCIKTFTRHTGLVLDKTHWNVDEEVKVDLFISNEVKEYISNLHMINVKVLSGRVDVAVRMRSEISGLLIRYILFIGFDRDISIGQFKLISIRELAEWCIDEEYDTDEEKAMFKEFNGATVVISYEQVKL